MERPNSFLFHWIANIFFASVALLGGKLFGLEVSGRGAIIVIVFGALLLVPVTRRWERTAIEGRRANDARSLPGTSGEESDPD